MAYEEESVRADVISIKRMDEYDVDVRDQVADIYVEGFYAKFAYFTKDRIKMRAAFRDQLRADMFFVAEVDGRIVGIVSCSDNRGRSIPADPVALRKSFGLVMGPIAYRFIKKEFNDPLPYDDDTGYIECAATSADARGKGVSTALFRHVMDRLPYSKLVLEVLDVNDNARRLYGHLGFEEFERTPAKGGERRMFNERIYMRWQRVDV